MRRSRFSPAAASPSLNDVVSGCRVSVGVVPRCAGPYQSAWDLAVAIGASYGATELASDPAEDGKVLVMRSGRRFRFANVPTVASRPSALRDGSRQTGDDHGETSAVSDSSMSRRSYHLFGLAMQAADRHAPSIPAWLVCDAEALARYGPGMIRPRGEGGRASRHFCRRLPDAKVETVAELLRDDRRRPAVLTATIERFNAAAGGC